MFFTPPSFFHGLLEDVTGQASLTKSEALFDYAYKKEINHIAKYAN